ncbi:response regulator transcription factor [Shewanella khirikhana]|uniref:Transcriptional regulatory protein DegU n=1 Tax=Shewanella khirikhana TaxID=1965282 RepID=A0ABM7DSV3_9GAMM|nr:response regulator transcription factor [Shewanella khirikhana]AZQ12790.1 Transcriptional regulatory protein DegU [Shewanella khirikhana]
MSASQVSAVPPQQPKIDTNSANNAAVKVMVVDDQLLVLEGLCSLLSLHGAIKVVAKATSAEALPDALAASGAELLIMDVRMPGLSGIEALKLLREQERLAGSAPIPVLMLSTFDEHELVLESLRLGAQGYLRKDISFQSLTEAVLKLAAGKRHIQPAVTAGVVSRAELESLNRDLPYTPLSDCELDVLRLMAAGYSNVEIASALFKSRGTIRNQVSSILTKLVARDRTRAVLRGIELKLL